MAEDAEKQSKHYVAEYRYVIVNENFFAWQGFPASFFSSPCYDMCTRLFSQAKWRLEEKEEQALLSKGLQNIAKKEFEITLKLNPNHL